VVLVPGSLVVVEQKIVGRHAGQFLNPLAHRPALFGERRIGILHLPAGELFADCTVEPKSVNAFVIVAPKADVVVAGIIMVGKGDFIQRDCTILVDDLPGIVQATDQRFQMRCNFRLVVGFGEV